MGFLGNENSTFELVLLILICICLLILLQIVLLSIQKGNQLKPVKLIPLLTILILCENVSLLRGTSVSTHSAYANVVYVLHACISPLFLYIIFEITYIIHKRRSVKFCGIQFDEGHRINTEPCSWFLRNFIFIIAAALLVIGIIVDLDLLNDDHNKAGEAGIISYKNNFDSLHFLLSIIPPLFVSVFGIYIGIIMWRYGTLSSFIVYATYWNPWILLFIGTLVHLGGQLFPSSIYGITTNIGETFLLFCLVYLLNEIERDTRHAKSFNNFLKRDFELQHNDHRKIGKFSELALQSFRTFSSKSLNIKNNNIKINLEIINEDDEKNDEINNENNNSNNV